MSGPPSGQDARISQNRAAKGALQKKYQRGLNPGQNFIAEDIQEMALFAKKAKDSNFIVGNGNKAPFVQSAFHTGNYVPQDDKDSWYETYTGLVKNDGAKTYGNFTAPPDVVDYVEKKKDQLAYLDELRKAEFLVDNTDPSTLEKLYELYPELKEVPRKWYKDMLALQFSLFNILFKGRIESREDHNLIMHICSPYFIIPIYPAWDPVGLITFSTTWSGLLENYQTQNQNNIRRSIWNPFQRASDQIEGPSQVLSAADFEAGKWIQQPIKLAIIRRLYPRLANKGDGYILNRFHSQLPKPDWNSPDLLNTNNNVEYQGFVGKTTQPPWPFQNPQTDGRTGASSSGIKYTGDLKKFNVGAADRL